MVNFGLQTRVAKSELLRLAKGEHIINEEEVIPLSNTGNDQPFSIHTAPDVLTVEEAAKLMRLGRNSMYEAVRTKQVPAVKIGKRLLIPKSTLIRLLNLNLPPDDPEQPAESAQQSA